MFAVPILISGIDYLNNYSEIQLISNLISLYSTTLDLSNTVSILDSSLLSLLLYNNKIIFSDLSNSKIIAEASLNRLNSQVIPILKSMRDINLGNLTETYRDWSSQSSFCTILQKEGPEVFAKCGHGANKLWDQNLILLVHGIASTGQTVVARWSASSVSSE